MRGSPGGFCNEREEFILQKYNWERGAFEQICGRIPKKLTATEQWSGGEIEAGLSRSGIRQGKKDRYLSP